MKYEILRPDIVLTISLFGPEAAWLVTQLNSMDSKDEKDLTTREMFLSALLPFCTEYYN